jgi:hypothetical protein
MGTDNTTPRVLEITAEMWTDAEAIVDGEVRFTLSELCPPRGSESSQPSESNQPAESLCL